MSAASDNELQRLFTENETLRGKLNGYHALGRLLMTSRQENQALLIRNKHMQSHIQELQDNLKSKSVVDKCESNIGDVQTDCSSREKEITFSTNINDPLFDDMQKMGVTQTVLDGLCKGINSFMDLGREIARLQLENASLRVKKLEKSAQLHQQSLPLTATPPSSVEPDLGEQIKCLEAKVIELQMANYRWDDYCRSITNELAEERAKILQHQEEHTAALRQLEDVSFELANLRTQPQNSTAGRIDNPASETNTMLRAEVDLLKAQLLAYTEDFAAERADRELARGELDSTCEELKRLRSQLDRYGCDANLHAKNKSKSGQNIPPRPPLPRFTAKQDDHLIAANTRTSEDHPYLDVCQPPDRQKDLPAPPYDLKTEMDASRLGTLTAWNCERCTFRNRIGAHICEVCNFNFRPPPYNPYSIIH